MHACDQVRDETMVDLGVRLEVRHALRLHPPVNLQ